MSLNYSLVVPVILPLPFQMSLQQYLVVLPFYLSLHLPLAVPGLPVSSQPVQLH